MDKDTIFFGESGLTTTSANYCANMAKESYRALEQYLDNVVFYTTEVGLIGSTAINTLKEGVKPEFLAEVQPNLLYIAGLKSLIAWLREAIKAKERLIKGAQALTTEEIAKELGIEMPSYPSKYERLTEDAIVATWTIKQRNRYYYLDTLCAVIGSYIHPSGKFALCKEKLSEVLTERHTCSGSGRDMVIYTKTPTVELSKVEDTFFALQNEYRGYQSELNSLKHSIELTLQEDEREKSLKESQEVNNYYNLMKDIEAKAKVYKNEAIAKAQALKIVIPDSLKPIYDKVSGLGK